MKGKRYGLWVMLFVLAFVLSACGGSDYAPRAIKEETDRCAACNMLVRDDRYAAQIITKDGQAFKFDDIGCLYEWMAENGTESIGAAYVRDYRSEAWIRREKAYYVYDPSFQTPMAHGVLSFETETDARSFIREQGKGKLMSAEDLDRHDWKAGKPMHHNAGSMNHSTGHNTDSAGSAHSSGAGH
jgi:copper chaperone NosL